MWRESWGRYKRGERVEGERDKSREKLRGRTKVEKE